MVASAAIAAAEDCYLDNERRRRRNLAAKKAL
jgi:hypothetical protein